MQGGHHVAEKSTILIVPGVAMKEWKSFAAKACDEEVLAAFFEQELNIPSARRERIKWIFTLLR